MFNATIEVRFDLLWSIWCAGENSNIRNTARYEPCNRISVCATIEEYVFASMRDTTTFFKLPNYPQLPECTNALLHLTSLYLLRAFSAKKPWTPTFIRTSRIAVMRMLCVAKPCHSSSKNLSLAYDYLCGKHTYRLVGIVYKWVNELFQLTIAKNVNCFLVSYTLILYRPHLPPP